MPISVYRARRVPSPAEVEWLLAGITRGRPIVFNCRHNSSSHAESTSPTGIYTCPRQVWPLPKIVRDATRGPGVKDKSCMREEREWRGSRVFRVGKPRGSFGAFAARVPWNRRKRLRGRGDRSPRRSQTGVSDSCPRRRLPTYCSPSAGAAPEMTSEADALLPPVRPEGWSRHLLESRDPLDTQIKMIS